MIAALRQDEVVILHSHDLNVSSEDRLKVAGFLEGEYLAEALSYPYTAPDFDVDAAVWAAEVTYLTAQLILNRQHESKEFPTLFPKSPSTLTATAVLSADLTLRFLPQMVRKLKELDIEDELIPYLEELLAKWHFSGIDHEINNEALNFGEMMAHPGVRQIYVDRVIACKNHTRAMHPVLQPWIKATLGIHQPTFWKEFDTTIT